MGLCVSSEPKKGTKNGEEYAEKLCSRTIKIIRLDGKLQELKNPVKASKITSHNPNCFLCNVESMSIGAFMPQVPEEEELKLGQVYFLLPLSQAMKPLSLPDLCDLAIKASYVLDKKSSLELSSANTKLICP